MAAVMKFIVTGGTDIDFRGATYQALSDWQPKVAKRIRHKLGGVVYQNAVETLPVRVKGTSVPTCLAALYYLSAVLDQAALWHESQGVDAESVLFQYQPDGSALASPQQAPVLGVPEGSPDLMSLRPRFDRTVGAYAVLVDLQFVRHGRWLGPSEQESLTSQSVSGIKTVTFTDDLAIASPLTFTYSGFTATVPMHGYFLATNDAAKLAKIEAESGSGGSSSVNANASGGTVMRYSSSSGATTATGPTFSAAQATAFKRVHIFGLIQAVSGGVSNPFEWTATPRLNLAGGAQVAGRPVTFEVSQNVKKWHYLGTVWSKSNPSSFSITYTPQDTTTNYMDVDYYLLLADDEAAQVIRIDNGVLSFASSGADFVIADNSLVGPAPLVYTEEGSTRVYVDYGGNGRMNFSGDTVVFAACVTSQLSSSLWGYSNTVGIDVDRLPASLVPR